MSVHNSNFYVPRPDGIVSKPDPNAFLQAGAILQIEIHVPQKIAQVLAAQGATVPPPETGLALIDTGATLTCVHEPILQKLNLNPVGAVNSGTAGGQVQQNMYPASLHFTTFGFGVEPNAVVGVDLTGQTIATIPPQNIIALIGRNLLSKCVLVWNGPGACWTLAI